MPKPERTMGPRGGVSAQTRRRFERRRWARRWSAARVCLVALLVAVLGMSAAWLVGWSSVLTVKQVEVNGTDLLSRDQVRAAAALLEGEPLARVDLAAAQARIEALAEVRSAEVSRAWPTTVRVDVVERVSVALVDFNGTLRGMDQDGIVFQSFDKPPAGLPRVRSDGTPEAEARREVARVVSSLPAELVRRVEYVEVETIDQISLALRDGQTALWGSAEQSALKAEVLTQLLERVPARTYDVSVPERPVTSPAER